VALEFAHGRIDWLAANTVGTTHVVNTLSFQPKALMFVINGQSSATDAAAENLSARMGIGFASGTADRRCVGMIDTDAAGTMDCGDITRNDAVVATVTGAGGVDGLLDLTALASNGFTLTVDDQGSVNLAVFWFAWGGSDITNVETLTFTEAGATGTVDYGTFAPDVVFFAASNNTADNTQQPRDARIMFGAGTGSGGVNNQFVFVANQDDASTASDTDRYGLNSECVSQITEAGGNPNARGSYQGTVVANTFRINWLARFDIRRYIALSIKGGQWKANAQVADTSPETISGLAFQPAGAIIATHGTTGQLAGTSTTEGALSVGCFSSTTSERAMAFRSENSTASSAAEIDLAIEYDACAIYPSAAGGLDTVLHCSAINSDGFALSRATGTTNMMVGFVAFASTGGGPITGTLTSTLGTLTSTTEVDVAVTGTATPTLGTLTATTDVDLAIVATGSPALDALTSTTDVDVLVTGTTSATLGAVTGSATGTVASTGSATPTLGAVTAATDVDVAIVGATAATLGAVTSSSDVDALIAGSTTATLDAATLAASGTVTEAGITGTLDATLGSLTGSGAGVVLVAGTGTPSLEALTLESTGGLAVAATLTGTLGVLASTADGDVIVVGQTAAPLGVATLTAEGAAAVVGQTTATLGTLTLEAQGGSPALSGDLNQTLGVLTATTDADTLVVGAVDQVLGALTGVATATAAISGTVTSTLEALTGTAEGDVLVVGTTSASLGAVTLSAQGGFPAITGEFTQTLGAVTATGTASAAIVGEFAQTLGGLTAAGTGTLTVTGVATAALGAVSANAAAGVAITGTAAALLGAATSSGAAAVGITGTAAITLGVLTLAADGGEMQITGEILELTATWSGPLTLEGQAGATGFEAIALAAITLLARAASNTVN
jgi:hypothetical protein